MKRMGILAALLLLMMSVQTTIAGSGGQDSPVAPRPIEQWKNRVAASSELFADWKQAAVHPLYKEPAGSERDAAVWHVEQENRDLGYFVTLKNGRTLVEFSPVTPVPMLAANQPGTYLYAGPGMHLYQPAGEQPDRWMNLSNGETITGKPIPVKFNADSASAGPAETAKPVDYGTDPSADRGVAVMLQHSFGKSLPFDAKSLPKAGEEAGYLVYTVLDHDYYSVWAITGLQPVGGESQFLQIEDVFAGARYPVYVRTGAAVNWVGSR